MNKTIPLFGIYRDEAMEAAALSVLRSGQIATGAHVSSFTIGFGSLVNQPHVVTVNDMSAAIQIALRVANVGPGDEVLASAFGCMSTNAPIATSGATAVWVDVDPCTGAMDPEALERAITPRSKAVIVYHLAGYPADIRRIAAICRKRGLKLIEDCDNALLATVGGAQVGTFGDFAIYSFYPNRQINATEGGALCCRDGADAERATRLRRYGIDLQRFRDARGEIDPACDIPEIGWAATLNNLCSAIGEAQLGGVADRVAQTRRVAKHLAEGLAQIEGVDVINPIQDAEPSYWAFLIKLRKRDEMLAALKNRGVQVSKLHHRTDRYSGFIAVPHDLPATREFAKKMLALPCGWWMNEDDTNSVIESVRKLAINLHAT